MGDDGGQTPNVGLVAGHGGLVSGKSAIVIFDQRFSNSLWLGSITGWTAVNCVKGTGTDPLTSDVCTNQAIQSEDGDNYILSITQFSHAALTTSPTGASLTPASGKVLNRHYETADIQLVPGTGVVSADLSAFAMVDNTAGFPTKTSQNTGHYFAVGSTIEVLGTSWDTQDKDADIVAADIPNAYRTFKVLSHVSNVHGQTFAKLDSSPTTSTSSINYALKVTTHNSTVTERTAVTVNGAKQEIQALWSTHASTYVLTHTAGDLFRIYINANKPNAEFTEVLSGASTAIEVEEAINAFSALSGPVSVALTNAECLITFAEIDGDVPQLTVVDAKSGNTDVRTIVTLVEGWSFFAGESARLSHVQPGSIINVTASEVVSFTIGGPWSTGNLLFSYDGTVASAPHTFANKADAAEVVAAISSIKDAKGASKITVTATASQTSIVVTMPEGADGSKLELVPTSATDTAGAPQPSLPSLSPKTTTVDPS